MSFDYLHIFQNEPIVPLVAGNTNTWTIPHEHQWTKLPLRDNTVYLVVTNWCGYSKAAKEPFLRFIKNTPGYFIDYEDAKFKNIFHVSGVPAVFVMHKGTLHKINQSGTIEEQLQIAKQKLE